MGERNSKEDENLNEEEKDSMQSSESNNPTETWVKLKNSNPGPPMLDKAIAYAKENGHEGLYEETLPLTAYSIPSVPSDVFALVIPSVLSKQECQDMINVIPFKGQGYMSPKDIKRLYRDRVVHRYMSRDPFLSALILQRIRPFLPINLDGGEFVAISPNWRFLRYDVGGHQASHLDGRENSSISMKKYRQIQSRLTIQMYLNDHQNNDPAGYRGGEMVFYQPDCDTIRHIHYPSAGDCIVFFQEAIKENSRDFELIHEAKTVIEGTKYAMRTVVDYGWV